MFFLLFCSFFVFFAFILFCQFTVLEHFKLVTSLLLLMMYEMFWYIHKFYATMRQTTATNGQMIRYKDRINLLVKITREKIRKVAMIFQNKQMNSKIKRKTSIDKYLKKEKNEDQLWINKHIDVSYHCMKLKILLDYLKLKQIFLYRSFDKLQLLNKIVIEKICAAFCALTLTQK